MDFSLRFNSVISYVWKLRHWLFAIFEDKKMELIHVCFICRTVENNCIACIDFVYEMRLNAIRKPKNYREHLMWMWNVKGNQIIYTCIALFYVYKIWKNKIRIRKETAYHSSIKSSKWKQLLFELYIEKNMNGNWETKRLIIIIIYCVYYNLPSEFDLSASAWAANALVRSNNISWKCNSFESDEWSPPDLWWNKTKNTKWLNETHFKHSTPNLKRLEYFVERRAFALLVTMKQKAALQALQESKTFFFCSFIYVFMTPNKKQIVSFQIWLSVGSHVYILHNICLAVDVLPPPDNMYSLMCNTNIEKEINFDVYPKRRRTKNTHKTEKFRIECALIWLCNQKQWNALKTIRSCCCPCLISGRESRDNTYLFSFLTSS